MSYDDEPEFFAENKPQQPGEPDHANLAEIIGEERLAECTIQKRRLQVLPPMCCPRCKIELGAHLQDTAVNVSTRVLLLCRICGIGWRIVAKSATLVQARQKEQEEDTGV